MKTKPFTITHIDGKPAFLTTEKDGRFTWNIAFRGALLTGYVSYKRRKDAFRAARRIYKTCIN